MTTHETTTEIPDIDPETLCAIINGAAAIGHALALLKPNDRSRTTLQLLGDLTEMRQLGETTELFIVDVALKTCADHTYPERLTHLVLAKMQNGEAANDN